MGHLITMPGLGAAPSRWIALSNPEILAGSWPLRPVSRLILMAGTFDVAGGEFSVTGGGATPRIIRAVRNVRRRV